MNMTKFRCKTCKKNKPLTDFHKRNNHSSRIRNNHQLECKQCIKIKMANYYQINKRRLKAKSKKYHKQNREKCLLWFKQRTQQIRDIVFAHYGGYMCTCCGEIEPLFLTLDHINNDGATHRKSLTKSGARKDGADFYRWLIKNNFPAGLQVLCWNCNAGKHRNGGVCPHKEKELRKKIICA